MIKVLAPIFNSKKNRFAEGVRRLIIQTGKMEMADSSSLRLFPLVTHVGFRLFGHIFPSMPELGKELVLKLKNSGERDLELIASWLIFRECFLNNDYLQLADECENMGANHRMVFAYAVCLFWREDRDRAKRKLKIFFHDPDPAVRKQAADIFETIEDNEVLSLMDVGFFFIESPAYQEHSLPFLRMLEKASCDVLEIVIDATQRSINGLPGNADRFGKRFREFHYLKDLLKREYSSSESKPEARKKILDMIDLLLYQEVGGVEEILVAYDRS